MFLKPRLLVIVTSLLLLAGIRGTQAAVTKIVSPGDYEYREGEESVEGSLAPYRFQQVFPAADFAALGNKPHWLVDFTVRPDVSLMSPRTVHLPDHEIRLATMPVGPPNLSSNFAINLGSDFKHFYRGPHNLVADARGPGPGPREFYNPEFPAGVTPYPYDPSQGNLLIDMIVWQGTSPSLSGDKVPGIRTSQYAFNPLVATQGISDAASIFQFTFIPVGETSTWTVDAGGNWSLPANWASGFPNLTGAQAVLGSVITAPRTVTVNAPITVGASTSTAPTPTRSPVHKFLRSTPSVSMRRSMSPAAAIRSARQSPWRTTRQSPLRPRTAVSRSPAHLISSARR